MENRAMRIAPALLCTLLLAGPVVEQVGRALRIKPLLCTLLLAGPVVALPFPPQPGDALANRLPDPPVEDDAPPRAFLLAARLAITNGRMAEAMETLERDAFA
jgi:hypothetical protein